MSKYREMTECGLGESQRMLGAQAESLTTGSSVGEEELLRGLDGSVENRAIPGIPHKAAN